MALTRRRTYSNIEQRGYHRGLQLSVMWDTREFERLLHKAETSIFAGLRRGLKLALAELMRDIVEEAPTAPILTGALRGSMTYFVNKVFKGSSEKYGPPTFQLTTNTETRRKDEEEGMLVVNAPYATVQHEQFSTKRVDGVPGSIHPTAGRFYMLRKLRQFGGKYMDIITDEMKRTKI